MFPAKSRCYLISLSLLSLMIWTKTTAQKLDRTLSAGYVCDSGRLAGLAVLYDTFNRREVVFVSENDKFWIRPASEITQSLRDQQRPPLFSNANSRSVSRLRNFPPTHDAAVSFPGLPRSNPFYNNLFIFRNNTLYRYKFFRIEATSYGVVKFDVFLVGTHKMDRWVPHRTIRAAAYIIPVRGANLLALGSKVMLAAILYRFNEKNLDKPQAFQSGEYNNWNVTYKAENLRILYRLESRDILAELANGRVCHDQSCAQAGGLFACNSSPNPHPTRLSARSLGFTVISMIINIILLLNVIL